jgi:hypothetical protein
LRRHAEALPWFALTTLFAALLRVHLFCALAATLLFWLAACSPKGLSLHRRAGQLFARFIYAAAATGGLMAVAALAAPGAVHAPDPLVSAEAAALALRANRQTMWLVLYILLIIVTPVQHGLAVIEAGAAPMRVRSRLHATLNLLSMIGTLLLLAAAVAWQQWLFLLVVPIGLAVGLRNLSYALRRTATRGEWEREHLTSLVTAGITLHTAFFVFGTSRTLGWRLTGIASLVPWVVPALVGVPVIAWLRLRRR